MLSMCRPFLARASATAAAKRASSSLPSPPPPQPSSPVVAATSSRPESILPEGTEIPVNYLKAEEHPKALADHEYPDWLWTITSPPKKEFTAAEKRDMKYIKAQRTDAIKLKNFLKSR
ncbi:mitochondrial ribosomal protein L37-domain-containing protein [Blastocladiella britannica]|nr:mitochondrial ribosomal protein L37-domain-containing protein [Blastocladiella britannica]